MTDLIDPVVCLRPRLCKNVFQYESYSKPDWKPRFYAKSTSADVLMNFRFNVEARTSNLATRFYTLWAISSRSNVSTKPGAIHASNPALLVCADQRIRAIKNLLQCLSLISASSSDPHVLSGVCEASALLLQEGCDLLGVLTLREDTVH